MKKGGLKFRTCRFYSKQGQSKTMNNLPNKIVSMFDRTENAVDGGKGNLTKSYKRQEDMEGERVKITKFVQNRIIMPANVLQNIVDSNPK